MKQMIQKRSAVLRDQYDSSWKPRTVQMNAHGVMQLIKSWWTVVLLAVCLLLVAVARMNPQLTERWFSRGFYPLVARTWGAATSLLPFSLVELGIALAVVAVPILILAGVVTLLSGSAWERRARGVGRFWRRLPLWVLKVICLLISLFILFCGLNYYRPTYTEMSGLSVRESSVDELAALCTELTERANALSAQMPRDATGAMVLSQNVHTLFLQTRDAFGKLAVEQPELLPDFPIMPKPVVASKVMSMGQITGVFCPVTFESNVNVDAPPYLLASTACHELAHTRGFMREDEANFLGYLACVKSGTPELEYSGVMLALLHVQNSLGATDVETFRAAWELSNEQVRRDFAYNNEYWARYEGLAAEVTTTVNDAYLKLNNQTDGVQSYGRMVDLLLADYRMRHAAA